MRWALEFARRAQRTTSAGELGELLYDATVDMGFDYYALIRCDTGQLTDEYDIHLFNFPRPWTDEIHRRNYFKIDPVRAAARERRTPFRTHEVGGIPSLTPDQQEMMAASGGAGLSDGFATPIAIADEAVGLCSFGLGSHRDFPRDVLGEAEIIGGFAFEAARRLKAHNTHMYLSTAGKHQKGNGFWRGLRGLQPDELK